MDAFTHVMEQYLIYPVDARIQDRMAEGILQTLIEIGATAVSESENYDVRANHVWSATMALNGLIGTGVPWDLITHFIGHELTALYGIDHGQTLAIILPAVMNIRREPKKEKLLQYAERVWNIKTDDNNKTIDLAIEKTREFFESLGIKTRLSDYGVSADKIPAVIEKLEKHGMTAMSERQDITLKVSQQILENAL